MLKFRNIALLFLASQCSASLSAAAPGDMPMARIDGQWLPAISSALGRFQHLKKEGLDCYKVAFYEEGNNLIAEFNATPKHPSPDTRGQEDACGPSVAYTVNRDGLILKQRFLQ